MPYIKRCNIQHHRQVDTMMAWADPDLVVHLAAEFGRWNGEAHYEDLWLTNVVGTKHRSDSCPAYGSKIIFASSSEGYGNCAGVMMDSATPNYYHPLNEYATTKQVNEIQLENARRMHGVESMVVRIFNTYGPRMRGGDGRVTRARGDRCEDDHSGGAVQWPLTRPSAALSRGERGWG